MELFPYLAGVLLFMLFINGPQPFWLCEVVAAVAVVPRGVEGMVLQKRWASPRSFICTSSRHMRPLLTQMELHA